MNHQEAVREMSVEKYLLGELKGPSRDAFEEHLFDCSECATDLNSSMIFSQAARQELAAETMRFRGRDRSSGWFDWLLRPQWMVPALAACLLLMGYLSVFRIPALKQQLAVAESPRLLNGISLADGTMRGGSLPHASAPADGAVLLSVDLPQQAGYSSYLCSLLSPSGKLVWQASVLPSPASETIQISVPAASTQVGENTVVIQGSRQGAPSGAALVDLARHPFVLELQN